MTPTRTRSGLVWSGLSVVQPGPQHRLPRAPTYDDSSSASFRSPGPDTGVAALWPVVGVVECAVLLAFDHARVLSEALDRTSVDLATTDLALAFVGSSFTRMELHSVFEAVWSTTL